jgi:hypothetical protein
MQRNRTFHPRRGRHMAGTFACVALAALALSGCSSARQTFGLDRTPPDEYAVVSRAPLAIPPEFRLRPPQPGAPRPQEGNARQQAAATVFGAPAAPVVAGTPGESSLLTMAGAGQAEPGIRGKIDRESDMLAAADRTFIDKLIFWQTPEPAGSVVNAQQEAQRLRENAALGKPVTAGNTPVIERRRKAPLEGLFN